MRNWRTGPVYRLNTRPIYTREWPQLIKAMIADELIAQITPDGLIWYSGQYVVSKGAIRDVWGLSVSQMKRLEDYIYVNDPFPTFPCEEEE